MFVNDIKFFYPEFFIILSSIFLLIYGVFYESLNKSTNSSFTVSAAQLSIFMFILVLILLFFQPSFYVEIFSGHIAVGGLAKFFRFILSIFIIFFFIGATNYLENKKNYSFEFIILMLFSVLGMFFIITSQDTIMLYLSLEFQSLPLYVLAASKQKTKFSTEAGIKYFVLGSVSSGFFLFGVSLLYLSSGLTNFQDLLRFFINQDFDLYSLEYFGIIFLLIGILFKFPSAPFHNWAPDVYQGAPTIVTAFFVLLPKIGIFSILSKLCFQLFQFSNNFLFIILYLCSFFSLVIGSFGAMYQFEIKRFIAYSTISHVGFILISLSTFSLEGFKSAIFYLVGYLLLNLNFFIILLSVQFTNHFKINFLYELVYLCYSNSFFGVSIALVFFSMAGIPPLVGFFTKFFILLSTIQENMYFISFVMIFFSVLSCAYYIRIVRLLYFDKFNSFHNFTFKVNNFNIFYVWVILILILTLVNIFFFAILDPFFLRVESSIFVTFSLLWLIGLEEVGVILLLLDKNLICMVQSNCGMLKERIMFILDIFNAQLLILFSLIKR